MKPVKKLWTLSEFCCFHSSLGLYLLKSYSHQVLTLLMGDKLYLAPLSENIQVWSPK
jgi:hypothetical protein